MTEVLDPQDAADLERLENVIDEGLPRFMVVGNALAEIKDRKLYRLTHRTFQDYCHRRFKISRAHGYRLISAAEVAKALSPIGDILNEAQARELAGFPPEIQAKVIEEVNEDPTAQKLREALDEATVQQIQEEEDEALADKPDPKVQRRHPRRDLADRMESWNNLGRRLIERHYHDVAPQALAVLDELMRTLRSSSEV